MSRSGHSRAVLSGPRRRASWLLARNRVLVPPAPAGPGGPDGPGAGQAGETLAPSRSAGKSGYSAGGQIHVGPSGGQSPAQPRDRPISVEARDGLPTPARQAIPARAVVPASAPGRRGIAARWHLLRLAVLVVVAVVIAVGISDGRGPDASAEPAVESFLLAWQQGQYLTAARLTNGNPVAVARALRTAYDQLDAAALSLTMGPISQNGHAALARFDASVDLGQSGALWSYVGWFPLNWTPAGWKIRWSPADIEPALRPGTRLAVRTTLLPRALILDASGQPLQQPSASYVLGVQPGKLADPAVTAKALGQVTGLDSGELLAAIQAGTGQGFLGLVTLDPGTYARLRPRLAGVPGLVIHSGMRRLFDSIASDVVGSVGTEVAAAFRQDGVAYQPGDTVGLSGLEQYYQHRLVGMPATQVVVVDGDGHLMSVLHTWPGAAPQPVRTTLSPAVQAAANRALGTTPHAAAIVAVAASTGQILAVASQAGSGAGQPDPLDGRYPPGQAFTIVSTAALLDSGLSASAPVPCTSASDVGGEVFLNDPPVRSLGPQPTFGTDFAYGCETAFAGLSRRLSAAGLDSVAAGFRLGASWRLPLAASSGSMSTPGTDAQLAADTIGTGNIGVSPLGMALAAACVDSGQWHAPELVTSPASPVGPVGPAGPASAVSVAGSVGHAGSSGSAGSAGSAGALAALSPQVLSTLRTLMRATVRSGDAGNADVRGIPVYGQAGQAAIGQGGLPPTGQGGPAVVSRGGRGAQAWWFVGYRGDVAFAVLEVGRSSGSAVPLAAQFLSHLPSSVLRQ